MKMIGSDYVLEAHNIYHTREVGTSSLIIFCKDCVTLLFDLHIRWIMEAALVRETVLLWA